MSKIYYVVKFCTRKMVTQKIIIQTHIPLFIVRFYDFASTQCIIDLKVQTSYLILLNNSTVLYSTNNNNYLDCKVTLTFSIIHMTTSKYASLSNFPIILWRPAAAILNFCWHRNIYSYSHGSCESIGSSFSKSGLIFRLYYLSKYRL